VLEKAFGWFWRSRCWWRWLFGVQEAVDAELDGWVGVEAGPDERDGPVEEQWALFEVLGELFAVAEVLGVLVGGVFAFAPPDCPGRAEEADADAAAEERHHRAPQESQQPGRELVLAFGVATGFSDDDAVQRAREAPVEGVEMPELAEFALARFDALLRGAPPTVEEATRLNEHFEGIGLGTRVFPRSPGCRWVGTEVEESRDR
jgi:hypothetical protein